MKYEVKGLLGAVQFTAEICAEETTSTPDKLGMAIGWAVKNGADLRGANLCGANLRWADLHEAKLCGANLRGAKLHEADLHEADLREANLHGAKLCGANLHETNLHGADLRGANLHGAKLHRADLHEADLREANLHGAKPIILGGVRSDGYAFVGWRNPKTETLWVNAGCRSFSILEAREHWQVTRGGTQLGDESMALLDNCERLAKITGLTS